MKRLKIRTLYPYQLFRAFLSRRSKLKAIFKGLKNPFFCLAIISFVLLGTAVFIQPASSTILNEGGIRFTLSNTSAFGEIAAKRHLTGLNFNLSSKKLISLGKSWFGWRNGAGISRFSGFIEAKETIKESPVLNLIQKNSLFASSPPIMVTPTVLGALAGGIEFEEAKKEVIEYIVEDGDTLSSIAEKFNISLNTILWANDLGLNSKIKPGQKLIILPTSGLIHYAKKGDTISKIALLYKAKTEDIIVFNDLSPEGDITVGDALIIPNGVMPPKPEPLQFTPLAASYFICPISLPCRLTQGLHWHNAVDFSHGNCGEPIFAAAAGTVLQVKLTDSRSPSVFKGAGNHLKILHSNGVVTSYGHILTSLVNSGDIVFQGQIIALMGGQPGTPGAGRSSGCHLHFGVSGARNPFAK